MGADHCALYITSQGELELSSHTKLPPSPSPQSLPDDRAPIGKRFAWGRGLVGRVAEQGGVRLVDRPCGEEGFDPSVDDPLGVSGGFIQSMGVVAVPDPTRGECLAVLQVGNSRGVLVVGRGKGECWCKDQGLVRGRGTFKVGVTDDHLSQVNRTVAMCARAAVYAASHFERASPAVQRTTIM